ncbi:hypothetical protein CU098_001881, partial [Rhizopus stolonifer]
HLVHAFFLFDVSMSLLDLSTQLSKTFDECLETILSDVQQKDQNNKAFDAQLTVLKSSLQTMESQLKEIRLKALKNKELSLQESNKRLRQDIDIKKDTISKYMTKLEAWEKELPVLKQNSEKAMAVRSDGYDFDADNTTGNIQDEDEDEDVEFEEV